MEAEAGRCCLTQASRNRADVLAAVFAITATFVAKQTVVYCTRVRLCLFSKIGGFILGFFLFVSIFDFIFLDACDGKCELFSSLFSFSFPSHCFLFWSLKFLFWWLEPFPVRSFLFHYGVLAATWHTAVEIYLACLLLCLCKSPPVCESLSLRLLSPAYLHLCSFFFGTYPRVLHSSCFPCNKAVLIFFSCLGR